MQFCPRHGCNRAGDDLGDCGNTRLKCPRFREIDPLKDIVLRCSACDKTRCVPASDVMQGKSGLREVCDRSDCKAVVMVVPRSKAKPKQSDGPPEDVQ